ncbi:ATP synthase subunit I [Cerasibacillus terrae]|uniref:ATP synthase subunit I n=1 Tax=Cerasibacillus terrae TaxID=2498845 RepID=A0A5C8NZC3_9BACI|nr:ATP synthase subunit I [Cerasibacillus terrae]TXL66630.1 ATP synthase subunit I [Cerasibacillus terrae]
MSQYRKMVIRQRKWMLYLLSVIVLGAGFSPYPMFFFGLLLGSVFSFFNLWILHRNMERLGEVAIRKRKRASIGTLTRLGGAALATLIALRYEEYFHIIGVVIGLCLSYAVIIIDLAVYYVMQEKRS